ncbi:hypothetical protein FXF59_18555 [Microbispora tritici]|uniref:Uncharacterized protein n=2 Tax=Microbispora TaxID=2005 RepID=A0ABY3LX61_9ACTN|nr:hypothetical protein FED44_06520 [Microbispora fusca]TYB57552.1 hypothetical protein FXF59_18555 [Microbispora tritici]
MGAPGTACAPEAPCVAGTPGAARAPGAAKAPGMPGTGCAPGAGCAPGSACAAGVGACSPPDSPRCPNTSRKIVVRRASGEAEPLGVRRSTGVMRRSRYHPPRWVTTVRTGSGHPVMAGSTVWTWSAGSRSVRGRWSQRPTASRASRSQSQSTPVARTACPIVTDAHHPPGRRGSASISATC